MERAEIERQVQDIAERSCFGTIPEIAARVRSDVARREGVPEEWVDVTTDGSHITVGVRRAPVEVEIRVVKGLLTGA